LETAAMHLRHFARTLGEGFVVQGLTFLDLQGHIDRRAKKRTSRERPVSPVTLPKGIATLRGCSNWGVSAGILTRPLPSRGLRYPKGDEKPPFQTWKEIERKIRAGRLTAEAEEKLWECLFLTLPELTELLAFMKDKAAHPWIYPMACFAAHTGARRSEML